jgi:hypothetical protein
MHPNGWWRLNQSATATVVLQRSNADRLVDIPIIDRFWKYAVVMLIKFLNNFKLVFNAELSLVFSWLAEFKRGHFLMSI